MFSSVFRSDFWTRHKLWVVCLSLLGLGAALRLALIVRYPLWLDEQYSLLFAHNDSWRQLLIAGRDSHPGLFYFLLKLSTSITQNIYILRTGLSALPQLLGVSLLLVWMRRRAFQPRSLVAAATLLLLNPFFLFLSFQLRMYSLAFLLSIGGYIAFREWQRQQTIKNLLVLLTILAIGNASLYAFFFLTGSILLYFLWRSIQASKPVIWPVVVGGLFAVEFLVLNGLGIKQKYEQASSWIPMPSVTNVADFSWTVTGFADNFFLQERHFDISHGAFYVISLAAAYLVLRHRKNWRLWIATPQFVNFCFLFLLPVGAIVLLSFMLPVLSQRFFFYQFIPKLSLFLPRAFTPLLVTGCCLLAEYLGTRKRWHVTVTAVVVMLLVGWTSTLANIWQYADDKRNVSAVNTQQLQKLDQAQQAGYRTYLLPSWSYLTLIDADSSQSQWIEDQMVAADEFFSQLQHQNPQSCQLVQNSFVAYSDLEVADTAAPYYETHFGYLDRCCLSTEHTDQARSWQCQ